MISSENEFVELMFFRMSGSVALGSLDVQVTFTGSY